MSNIGKDPATHDSMPRSVPTPPCSQPVPVPDLEPVPGPESENACEEVYDHERERVHEPLLTPR